MDNSDVQKCHNSELEFSLSLMKSDRKYRKVIHQEKIPLQCPGNKKMKINQQIEPLDRYKFVSVSSNLEASCFEEYWLK